jgi:hypothetical protein
VPPTTSHVNDCACFANQSKRGGASPDLSTAQPVTLDAATIEAIAERVVELLAGGDVPVPDHPLVDARTLASRLGVSRDTVYEHAKQLCGERIGGSRGRLRFDLDRALAAWTARSSSEGSQAADSPATSAVPGRRRRGSLGSTRNLLPIHGDPSENGGV